MSPLSLWHASKLECITLKIIPMKKEIQNHNRNTPSIARQKKEKSTKAKLILTVSEIIRQNGYSGLNISRTARMAHVQTTVVNRYFGSFDKLIEAYVLEKDYCKDSSLVHVNHTSADLEADINGILEHEFDVFFNEPEMQQLIIGELCGCKAMKNISIAREKVSKKILKQTDDYFKGSDFNLRALNALLSAGLHYLILQGSEKCLYGINIGNPNDREEVKRTMRLLIKTAFHKAKSKT